MFEGDSTGPYESSEQLDYWLRRAEQESIAAIRASGEAAARHDAMALAYSTLALGLLGDRAPVYVGSDSARFPRDER